MAVCTVQSTTLCTTIMGAAVAAVPRKPHSKSAPIPVRNVLCTTGPLRVSRVAAVVSFVRVGSLPIREHSIDLLPPRRPSTTGRHATLGNEKHRIGASEIWPLCTKSGPPNEGPIRRWGPELRWQLLGSFQDGSKQYHSYQFNDALHKNDTRPLPMFLPPSISAAGSSAIGQGVRRTIHYQGRSQAHRVTIQSRDGWI